MMAAVSLYLAFFGPKGGPPPDEGWKGWFYSNPNDPALLVPKRYGVGFTLNFGNPWSWAVLALIILAVALPIVLGVMSIARIPRGR